MEDPSDAPPVPDMELTEEGKRSRVFHAYPAMTNTVRMLIFAVALVALVLGHAFYSVAMHRPVPVDEDEQPVDVWAPPVVQIVNLSEAVLSGLASGRTGSAVFDNQNINEALIARLGTVCATPWLQYAWMPGHETPPRAGAGAMAANVLSFAGHSKPLLNARITGRGTKTVLVTAPFKYRSTKDTRAIAVEVEVTHTINAQTERSFTTTTLDEAFCVQELYDD